MKHETLTRGAERICSCGETRPHRIAKRRTFDNVALLFWSDGRVTTWFGVGLHRKPFSAKALDYLMRVAEIQTFAEMEKLLPVARKLHP